MERLRANKIDLATARLATIHIPSVEDPFDGMLPSQEVSMVIADGKGKFVGFTLVEIGVMDRTTKTLKGFVYRQHVTYKGFRRGRDVFIDPLNLAEGEVTLLPDKRGLWVRLEELGTLTETFSGTS